MSRHIWDLLFEYEVLTGNCLLVAVPAWIKVQSRVWLYSGPKSTADEHFGRIDITCLGDC